MSLITLFSAPKPFTNPHIALIQRNAIRSWTLVPDVEVILLGAGTGLAEAARQLGVRHLTDVKCTDNGTPWVSSMFQLARENPQAVVNEALGQLETIEAAIAAQTAQLAAVPAVVEAAPGPDRAAITMPRTVRTELVDILLVEADEILQQVRTELGKCRVQPDDLVDLTAIRRGFHTLKGSGRMVGLADFAEAAWQVENVLNEWLQRGYPVITELAAFIDGAVTQFP